MGLRSIIPDPSASKHEQGFPEPALQGIVLDEGHLTVGVLKHPDRAKFCKIIYNRNNKKILQNCKDVGMA